MATKRTIKPFVVSEALLPQEDGGHLIRWYVYRDMRPVEAINRFLHRKSRRSLGTGRTYAYGLAVWLNFLAMRDTEYYEASRPDVDAFIDYLVHGMYCNSKILKLTEKVTYGTVSGALHAVQGFYRWFDGHVDVFAPAPPTGTRKALSQARRKAKHSFRYGQIYEVPVEEMVDIDDTRLRPPSFKKHWITESERMAILGKLRTVRDKAIFMLLCEGMRIDEVLSVKFSAYNSKELIVRPSRSKGYSEAYEEKLRIIAFHHRDTGEYLDQYIQTERADVEAKLGDCLIPLFVNMKNHPSSIGEVVTYRNYWGVLKGAVKRAGLNPNEISTHVGRRTFVQKLLDEGEGDETIRQLLGWATNQIDSYRNLKSKTMIKNAAEARRKDWDKKTATKSNDDEA